MCFVEVIVLKEYGRAPLTPAQQRVAAHQNWIDTGAIAELVDRLCAGRQTPELSHPCMRNDIANAGVASSDCVVLLPL